MEKPDRQHVDLAAVDRSAKRCAADPTIWVPLTNAKRTTLPLGIPNAPALRDIGFFAQSIHVDAKGLPASRGMAFRIE
jgi:hypothetical protein